jgi:hypothetical protein
MAVVVAHNLAVVARLVLRVTVALVVVVMESPIIVLVLEIHQAPLQAKETMEEQAQGQPIIVAQAVAVVRLL